MHDTEKEEGDAPLEPQGQSFEISVSDVISMLDRAYKKARAVEDAGGLRTFYENVTLPFSVVKSLTAAGSGIEVYYNRVFSGLSDIASGKKGKGGYAGDLHKEIQGISSQRLEVIKETVDQCKLNLTRDRSSVMQNAKKDVWAGHYKPACSQDIFDLIASQLSGASQKYRASMQTNTLSAATTMGMADITHFVDTFAAIIDRHKAQGAFLIWEEWEAVDALLQKLTLKWKPDGKWISGLSNFSRNNDDASKYDTARWVLGKCLEYQESDEDLDTIPRFRLKDWRVKLDELAQGDRLLVPSYSHTDLLKFIKILWCFLKPEYEERKGNMHQVLKFVCVDHEGCSSSFLINGFALDVVWTLSANVDQEIKVTLSSFRL